jgi:hypothetical protein
MARSVSAANVTNRGIPRWIFRWIHIVLSIPILGYIYSPFERIPNYAPATRFVFVPILILSGLWMWKGHVVRRLISKRSAGDFDAPSRREARRACESALPAL